MGILTNPIEKLRKLQAARNTLEADVIAGGAKLAELRAGIGDAALAELLEGGDSGPLRAEIYAVSLRIESHEAARPKLLAKIRAAIRELAHERAEEIRKKAEKRRGELAKHEAKIAELQTALETAAGCKYEQAVYAIEPGRTYAGQADIPMTGASIAQQMQAEIAQLNQAAARIEQQGEQSSKGCGTLRVEGLPAALKACENVETLMPTAAAVMAWYPAAVAAADADWSRHLEAFGTDERRGRPEALPERRTTVNLVWDAEARIDAAASRVTNRQLVVGLKPQAVVPVAELGPRPAA